MTSIFTPPTKRTYGQCSAECQRRGQALGSHYGHQPDCPALYPLQPQPGDNPPAPSESSPSGLVAEDVALEQALRSVDGWCSEAVSRAIRSAIARNAARISDLETKVRRYESATMLANDHQSRALRMGQQQGRCEFATELLEMGPDAVLDHLERTVREDT